MNHVVIGAHYGDEGKGLVTDYLATSEALVVRFNGGAQAGHTVVCPDGRSHEFHHVGAGTFRGARTLLSRFFVVNPMVFREEWDELTDLGLAPFVVAAAEAQVSTPWDALLNQAVEAKRGTERHGSCGVGINETVTRAERGYGLTMGDCWDLSPRELSRKVTAIAIGYVPARAKDLGVPVPDEDVLDFTARFVDDVHFLCAHLKGVVRGGEVLPPDDPLVFEGAQGLRLDEVRGTFPHVTRSRTGLTNVEVLLREAGRWDEPLQVHYVTRCYVTRHGSGPLPFEQPTHPWAWDGPETNRTNEWQGQLRYAPLSTGLLYEAARRDLDECRLPLVEPSYAVTCLDQMWEQDPEERLHEWFDRSEIPARIIASGPTRETAMRVDMRRIATR